MKKTIMMATFGVWLFVSEWALCYMINGILGVYCDVYFCQEMLKVMNGGIFAHISIWCMLLAIAMPFVTLMIWAVRRVIYEMKTM